ncbi:MAG: PhzF family phenazine biosynthesis protein [Planctomycetota bacterium]
MHLVQVDAFTTHPFSGNPAAVAVVDSMPDDATMQQIAREMNLSETAFVTPSGEDWALRWFTPTAEVELCGHATLASAHVLWTDQHASQTDDLTFETRSGSLHCRRIEDAIAVDFPAGITEPAEAPNGLLDAIGLSDAYEVHHDGSRWLVHVDDPDSVRFARPMFSDILRITRDKVMLTAAATNDDPYDFVSRFFAPSVGVNEDPVTGSAHCTLGPYWSRVLGKDEVTGYQCSARGGTVVVRPMGERVELRGNAVTVCHIDIMASAVAS